MSSLTTYGSSNEERLFSHPDTRNRAYFVTWLTSCVFLLGFVALGSRQPVFLPCFLAVGHLTLLFVFVRTGRLWKDPFNPLCLVLAIAFIRFSCPGFLQWLDVEPPENVDAFFQLMKLSDDDWQWAHALALTGLLAVVLGWFFGRGQWVGAKPLKFHLGGGVKYAALAGMLLGAMSLALFFLSNASLGAIASGEFRGTTIQEGTGPFFRLSYLLMGGSVLLCCYLLTKGDKRLSLVPVVIAMLLYWALGGRGRAVTSLGGGLLLLWYLDRERKEWRKLAIKPIHALLAPFGILFGVWVLYVGSLYRGGLGVQAFSESLSLWGLWQYIEGSIYLDLGQLHSLAGAIAIGPGVLGGQTFVASLTWPLEKFLPIPGRSAGVFIIDTLVGFVGDQSKWGVNASLIGDAYLNFGMVGVAIVMSLFGALLKILYLKFRQGSLHSAVYVLAILSGLQAFVVSIEVWPQAMITLAFAIFLISLGNTIFRLR
jgi:oligosaccharide repeat unit polymerase